MQDRYSGDIGDFSKFMLMKHVIGNTFGPVGLVWYAHPNEDHSGDGRHLAYLGEEAYIRSDRDLVDRLRSVAERPDRNTAGIQNLESMVLGPDVPCFSDPVPREVPERVGWLEKALDRTSGCSVRVLDPDNGMEPDTSNVGRPGRKYALLSEIRAFLDRSRVVVLYQHFHRGGTHVRQMKDGAERLSGEAGAETVFAVRFRGFSPRCYFLMVRSGSDREAVAGAIRRFREDPVRSVGWDRTPEGFLERSSG